MPLDTSFIAARPENEAPDSRIPGLLFVGRILKEGTAVSTEAAGPFPVHNRPDVRGALVGIACATLVMVLSLTELRFERFKLKIPLPCREAHSPAVVMSGRTMLNYSLLPSKGSSIWSN
jgi:hypothetical protein